MDEASPQKILAGLIAEHGTNYGALSRLIGRNPAYIQQFIKRGTPRRLDERDRRIL
ncbi:MAG: peptidase S24, partial [Sphingobium sp. 32-64-5]